MKFDIQWIPISSLRPAAYNPRKDLQPGDPEYIKLQKSLHEFGLVEPLVVNQDMTVIGGHQRLKVLQEAGFDRAPCSVVSLNKQKEKALNIALNKISGEWDFPKLKDLIIEIDDGSFDLEITGWGEVELAEAFEYEGKARRLVGTSSPDDETLILSFVVDRFEYDIIVNGIEAIANQNNFRDNPKTEALLWLLDGQR